MRSFAIHDIIKHQRNKLEEYGMHIRSANNLMNYCYLKSINKTIPLLRLVCFIWCCLVRSQAEAVP